jgi:transcriptional regulator with PAS, ATPase and Fis domain
MDTIDFSWIKEFPAAITVCDSEGTIIEMNDKSVKTFEKDGGDVLIGRNMFDCHPDPARGKLERIMDARIKNVYTIEKNGAKKLIYQSPWYKDGIYSGFVEMAFEIPFNMPHFIRK